MEIKPIKDLMGFLKPFADSLNIEIVDIEWRSSDETLTIFIENEQGMDLDTCEKFHNAIMDPIDEFDPTNDVPYTLAVSSPGLDRPFKTERDFARNIGKDVEFKLYAPIKGKKFFDGKLLAFDENTITVEIKGKEMKFERNKIAKINKAIYFE